MADSDGGGGGAEWQPIYDRVQAQAEALAADRARLEAASKVQRESWEAARRLQRSVEELQAAAQEKDAEIEKLRGEAADARKKLLEVRQADARRKMRWEAAYVELILGANQKLAELRDGDVDDSRIGAQTPNSKEIEICAKLSQRTADQPRVATDLGMELRKLKQAYETLSSKKDKEVSALLSEKELVRNQLGVMQREHAALLRKNKGEASQATETAQKLQQSVDELKVLAQNKDDEVGRLQVEAVAAEKKLHKMHSLVKEKDDEIQRLKGLYCESLEKRNMDISLAHKKSRSDDPAATVNDEPSCVLRQMVEENYISETVTVEKDGQDETNQKRRRLSSISNDDEQSGSNADDDEQTGSDEDDNKQSGSDEDDDEQTRSDEDGDEQSRSDDDDGQSIGDEHDEDEDEQSGRDVETTNNPVQKLLKNPNRKRGENHTESNGAVRTQWYWHAMAPAPLCSWKVQIINGQHSLMSTGNWWQYVRDVKVCLANQPNKPKEFVRFLCNFENWRIEAVAWTMAILLDGHPKLLRRFNRFLPGNCQIEVEEDEDNEQEEEKKVDEDEEEEEEEEVVEKEEKQHFDNQLDDEQTGRDEDDDVHNGSDEDGDEHSGSDEDDLDFVFLMDDEQTGRDEDDDVHNGSDEVGDEQSGSDEDGDEQSGNDEDGDEQSRSGHDDDEQNRSNNVSVKNWHYWYHRAPPPLLSQKLQISNGRHCLVPTGHWNNYVTLVNDSLADQPDKHKEFVQFLRNFENWRIRDVARTMQVVLDGHPKLIRQFNRFLPRKCQIKIEEREDEEKQNPDELPDDELSGSDADDDAQNGGDEDGDEQSGRGEDGDEQSRNDEDGDGHSKTNDDDGQGRSDEHNEDEDGQSGHDVEATNNPVQKPFGNLKRKRDACNAQVANKKSHIESNGVAKRRWSSVPPLPLRRRRWVTVHGRRSLIPTGNWVQYVIDVKNSLADQPDKRREFCRFLCYFQMLKMSAVARTMKVMLDGQPELIRRFNQFLPNRHQIEVKEAEDRSSCETMGAVAGLMKLKEAQLVSPRV